MCAERSFFIKESLCGFLLFGAIFVKRQSEPEPRLTTLIIPSISVGLLLLSGQIFNLCNTLVYSQTGLPAIPATISDRHCH